MAYEERTSNGKAISLLKNGDKVEGYYLGFKMVDGDYGPKPLHSFQKKDETIGVWGKTVLNGLLTPDLVGVYCWVTCIGFLPAKKGQKPPYGYKLGFDREMKLGATPQTKDEIEIDDTSFDVKQIESGAKTKASHAR
jgi:hypothetical protein